AHSGKIGVRAVLLHRFQLAAAVAGQAKGHKAVAVGPIDGSQDVRAVAAAADGNQQIASRAVVHELLDEDLVVAAVVAYRQKPAGVVGQAKHLETPFGLVLQVIGPQRALAEVFAIWAGGGASA